MTRRLVLATHNAHKLEELAAILGPALAGFELVPTDGPDPIEDGMTFAENALIKARAAVAHTGLPALADDSGIAVDALGGAPGIHSKRYAGTGADQDNIDLLLRELEGATDRTARFVCAAAFVDPDGTEIVEVAEFPGEVLRAPVGDGGFGYDPVFRPEGSERSLAEFSEEEKNAVSHRSLAFRALMPAVEAWSSGSAGTS
ncbi:MAG TPA: RdgB/HAM1 family non-canonical purine NTP pyrophosphatase [Microbacteriaceae bacterium]|nr:RdgB/HAM1 family non-canonical purine NTP pyrophosphatase [Microbacteriaceae bacterium]